ncbi:hypothetical protein [Bacteroides oleiciplenus]|uniref:hypothetical protein n=1 Tax=Bacteroides oleiciplenus TaxID=626931 RepID=UPI0002FA3B0F|nr:hypothetical protein [Bacteroides oleiciplenus]
MEAKVISMTVQHNYTIQKSKSIKKNIGSKQLSIKELIFDSRSLKVRTKEV